MRRLAIFTVLAAAGCASGKRSDTVTTVSPSVTQVATVTGTNVSMSSAPTNTSRSVVVQAPVERVWTLLPAVYEKLGIPVTTLVSTEYVIGNPSAKVRRKLGDTPMQRYLNCGTGSGLENAETYFINLSIHTHLRPDENGATTLLTLIDASATPPAFNTSMQVRCTSTGRLERRIAALIDEQLKT